MFIYIHSGYKLLNLSVSVSNFSVSVNANQEETKGFETVHGTLIDEEKWGSSSYFGLATPLRHVSSLIRLCMVWIEAHKFRCRRKPHCDSGTTMSTTWVRSRRSITRAKTLPAAERREIPLLLPHSARSPLRL